MIVGYAIGASKMLEPGYQRPDYNSAVSFIGRAGPPTAPVIDVPGPTPGPLTELDTAFAQAGRSQRGHHPILRLGLPSLSALERARPYAPVPSAPPAAVIRQAVDLPGAHTLFLVVLRPEVPLLRILLKPLPARFRHVETRTFAGLTPVLVYVFREH